MTIWLELEEDADAATPPRVTVELLMKFVPLIVTLLICEPAAI